MLTGPGWKAVVNAKEAAKARKVDELKSGGDENKPFSGIAPEFVILHPGKPNETRVSVMELADDGELMKTWLVERIENIRQAIETTGAIEAVVEFLGQESVETNFDKDPTRH